MALSKPKKFDKNVDYVCINKFFILFLEYLLTYIIENTHDFIEEGILEYNEITRFIRKFNSEMHKYADINADNYKNASAKTTKFYSIKRPYKSYMYPIIENKITYQLILSTNVTKRIIVNYISHIKTEIGSRKFPDRSSSLKMMVVSNIIKQLTTPYKELIVYITSCFQYIAYLYFTQKRLTFHKWYVREKWLVNLFNDVSPHKSFKCHSSLVPQQYSSSSDTYSSDSD